MNFNPAIDTQNLSSVKPIMELRNVSRTFMVSQGVFRGKKPLKAVNEVSLKVHRGEVLGLVGESGCGKTTLAMMLLGLLNPSKGEILIEDQAVLGWNLLEITSRIQPIFQDPYSSLNPRKTVGQSISLPLAIHKTGQKKDRRKLVEKMLEAVGLPGRFYNSYPNQLSGGQRQRVAIARALVMKPQMVICDEPTSALDVSVQSQILNLLLKLKNQLNLTYLFISHNLAVVEHLASRVAVMYLGRVVEEGGCERLFSKPLHPYTQALLKSVLLPEPGQGISNVDLGAGFPNPIDPPTGCTFHPRCSQVMDICRTQSPGSVSIEDGYVECHLYRKENKNYLN